MVSDELYLVFMFIAIVKVTHLTSLKGGMHRSMPCKMEPFIS